MQPENIKFFEIRDTATCIPILAIRAKSDYYPEEQLFARAGFGDAPICIILVHLSEMDAEYDWSKWYTRTLKIAHRYIEKFWEKLQSGMTIDVAPYFGETELSSDIYENNFTDNALWIVHVYPQEID